jgi:hypothetical protein
MVFFICRNNESLEAAKCWIHSDSTSCSKNDQMEWYAFKPLLLIFSTDQRISIQPNDFVADHGMPCHMVWIVETSTFLSNDCVVRGELDSLMFIPRNQRVWLPELSEEFGFNKVTCIHETHRSLTNEYLVKREFDSVICISGNHACRSSQQPKAFRFDEVRCIHETHTSLSTVCLIKISLVSFIFDRWTLWFQESQQNHQFQENSCISSLISMMTEQTLIEWSPFDLSENCTFGASQTARKLREWTDFAGCFDLQFGANWNFKVIKMMRPQKC